MDNEEICKPRHDLKLLELDLFCEMVFPTPRCCCPSVCSAHGYWNYLSPRMKSYNGVLAKAIDMGTSHLVKGIVVCSKAYASQVQRGANVISPQAASGASKTLGRHRWS